MRWFDKIKKPTRRLDNSAELKNGEIKQILIHTANEVLPDFEFLAYKNGYYVFQRLRQVKGLTVYESLHINFSLKERRFVCSIASRLNQEYLFVDYYNIGLINPHKDLKVLRQSTSTTVQDACYLHNGHVETATHVVNEIFQDYKMFGSVFLDKQFERLNTNEIIKCGLAFIDTLNVDKGALKRELEGELNEGGQCLSNLKHPIYLTLKEKLQSIGGQYREDRKLISKTAYELLEVYWS